MILGIFAGVSVRALPGLQTLSHSHAHEHGHEMGLWHLLVDRGDHHHHDDPEPEDPDSPDEHHHHCCMGLIAPLIAHAPRDWSARLAGVSLFGERAEDRSVPEAPLVELDTPPLI
jgi:ABC-type Zn2+ transport system substrate-binding protein/surface adhesin